MRVLFLHQFDLNLAGGSGVYLRSLTKHLRYLGHEVEVVSARWPDQYGCTTYELPFGFTVTFGPEKRPGERLLGELSSAELTDLMARAARFIENTAFRVREPDLILANHINLMAGVGLLLNERSKVPFRLISYGTDTDLLMRDGRYVDLFSEAAFSADRIFALSRYVARQIAATLPVDHVEVLGGAVDKDLFHPGSGDAHPPSRIAFIGRLVTEKGIWTLLDAVRRQRIHTELDIIGEGPLSDSIARHVNDSGMRSRVRLLGYVPQGQLREVLLRSAVLVVPSTWEEPLGLVVLEAMACGVPVVASEVGGIPEMIEDGVNGRLVEPGDAPALARTLDELMGDPALRSQLRENCLSRTRIASYRELAGRVVG